MNECKPLPVERVGLLLLLYPLLLLLLLRRRPRRRPRPRPRPGADSLPPRSGVARDADVAEAKVRELDVAVGRDEQVIRLDVAVDDAPRQGLTLFHFPAQPKPFWSHLPAPPCLIDWRKIMHPTYPTESAYVEPKGGRV